MKNDYTSVRLKGVISAIYADADIDLMEDSISVRLDLESVAEGAFRVMGIEPCIVNIYAGNLKVVMKPEHEDVLMRKFRGMKISQKKGMM